MVAVGVVLLVVGVFVMRDVVSMRGVDVMRSTVVL